MRILQIVQKPQRRGAEVFARQLTDRLKQKGCEASIVYLYAYSGPGCLPIGSEDRTLNGQQDHFFEKIPGWHPGLLRRLQRVVCDFGPDVIQLNGARTVKYGAFLQHFSSRKRWVLIYRNIGDPGQWIRGSIKRAFYRRFVIPEISGIVGVSHRALESIQDFYHPKALVVRIPTGFDDQATVPDEMRFVIRKELGCDNNTPVLIYVGSLTPEKRIDRLFRIVKRVVLSLPLLRVWLVGEGVLRSELMTQSRNEGLDQHIQFLGAREDIPSLLSAADLFVMTSDTEGIPAAILEAAFFERPAIVSDVGSISECVWHGETGFLFKPEAEQEFAGQIVRMFEEPYMRKQIGKQAKQRAEEHFALTKITSQYLEFYRTVVNLSSRQGSQE